MAVISKAVYTFSPVLPQKVGGNTDVTVTNCADEAAVKLAVKADIAARNAISQAQVDACVAADALMG